MMLFLIMIRVGIDWIPNCSDNSSSASELTVPKNKSGFFSASFLKVGPKVLHGPHQLAQKSRKTILFSSTILSILLFVTTLVLMSHPHIFNKSRTLGDMT
jgi:hypothetical protein